MYQQHFGFERMPFEESAAAAGYVDLPARATAADALRRLLESGSRVIRVCGAPGVGKTALYHHVRHAFGREPFGFASGPSGSPECPRPDAESNVAVVPTGGAAIVFFDDAQALSPDRLERLRALAGEGGRSDSTIRLVLFGRPELDDRREGATNASAGTPDARIELDPLDRKTCRLYIRGRLEQAGAPNPLLFTPSAIDRIHRASGGLPRLINRLCHESLAAAHADKEFQVGRRHVARALIESKGASGCTDGWQRRPLVHHPRLETDESAIRNREWKNLPGRPG